MKNKLAHIIGVGKSGKSAAVLLDSLGWRVIATDDNNNAKLQAVAEELKARNIEVFLGTHNNFNKELVDLVVASPGVPPTAEIIKYYETLHKEIISELELGWRYLKGRTAAISGANGKSTVTAMLGRIFSMTGKPGYACGNIGLPVCDIALETTDDALSAIEASSFQLMRIKYFKPDVSLLLNITPDHLDYHGGFHNYKLAKANIWLNQNENDWIAYNADDEYILDLIPTAKASKFPFSIERELDCGAFMREDNFVLRDREHNEICIPAATLRLLGVHNQANALAAISAAYLMGIDKETIVRGVESFEGLPHRLERVREYKGIAFINDSKSTSPDSGKWALKAMTKPVILIAGGRGKGGSFISLRPYIKEKVKKMILIGETARQIERELGDATEVERCLNLEHAVKCAVESASSGDVALLSPFAASFDMFENFEDRGNQFKKIVERLGE